MRGTLPLRPSVKMGITEHSLTLFCRHALLGEKEIKIIQSENCQALSLAEKDIFHVSPVLYLRTSPSG